MLEPLSRSVLCFGFSFSFFSVCWRRSHTMLQATRDVVSASVCVQWATVLVSDVLLALYCQGPD
jgi:amino acid permease